MNRAEREIEWIRRIKAIQKDIRSMRTDFMHCASSYRDKAAMENRFAEASQALEKFIDGVLEGQFHDKKEPQK